jgi:hypothetical protein
VRGQEGLLHSLKSHFVVSFSRAMMPLLKLIHIQIYYWTSLLLRCSCCEICTGLPISQLHLSRVCINVNMRNHVRMVVVLALRSLGLACPQPLFFANL